MSRELVFVCEEEWKSVPGYEGLEASSLGKMRMIDRYIISKTNYKRFRKGRILVQRNNHRGYPEIRYKNKNYRVVHKLVISAFKGERPIGYQINHINGIKTDNRPENLEYCTASENMKHSYKLGLNKGAVGILAGNCKLSNEIIYDIRKKYNNNFKIQEIADIFSISNSHTRGIIKRKSWKHLESYICLRDDRSIKSKESIEKALNKCIERKTKCASKKVIQLDSLGNIINIFSSVNKASVSTGIPRRTIGYSIDNPEIIKNSLRKREFYWKEELYL